MNNKSHTINFEHLEDLTKGDLEFKKELIEIFSCQIPVFIENLNKFYGEENWEKLAREAHTAKSSVLIFGMENTGKLLKDIQLLAENNKVAELKPALKKVISDLEAANIELQNI